MAADAERWWRLQQKKLLTFHPSSRSRDRFPLSWEVAQCTAWSTAAAGFTYSSDSNSLRCVDCKKAVSDIIAPIDLLALHQALDVDNRCPFLSFYRANPSPFSPEAADVEDEGIEMSAAITVSNNSQQGHFSPAAAATEERTLQQCYLSYLKRRAKYCARLVAKDRKRVPEDPTFEWFRMKSFEGYGRQLPSGISKRLLPAYGFFLRSAGEEKVCCAFCNFFLKLTDELTDDEVLKSHRSSSAACPFLTGKRCHNKPYMLDCWDSSCSDEENLHRLGIAGQRHEEPELAVQDRRRATYLTHPHNYGMDIESLCAAGFYYMGHGISVCFSCKLSVDNWEISEDPWQRHARASPSCQYLVDQKGAEYISQTIQQFGSYIPPVKEPIICDVTTRMLRPRLDAEVVQKAFAMGIDRQVVRTVLIKGIKNGDRDFRYLADIVRACQELAATQRDLQDADDDIQLPTIVNEPEIDFPSHEQSGFGLFEQSDIDVTDNTAIASVGAAAEAAEDMDFSLHTANKSSQGNGGQTLSGDPQRSTSIQDSSGEGNGGSSNIPALAKKVKARLICSICLSEPVGIVFLPCGHLVCCVTCAAAMLQCPMCRQDVRGTVRAYIPQ